MTLTNDRGAFNVILAGMALLAAACPSSPPEDDALVVAIEAMPTNLDPRYSTDALSSRIGELVHRSLTRIGPDLRPIGDLATSWIFEDDRTVLFRLEDGIRFHDGTPLTSKDVRATFESILEREMASPKRESLAVIDRIETPSSSEIRFRLRERFAPFLGATTVGVVPSEWARRRDGIPPGSGLFRIAQGRSGADVVLERVMGSGLGRLRFRVIPDDTVRALEVHQGAVDFVQNAIEPESLDWLRRNTDACIVTSPGTTSHYLGFNLRDPRLADVRVRRAIAHAIDREGLVRHLLGGLARPATTILAPSHWAYDPGIPEIAHDPTEARRLLEEAGVAPGSLRLTYKTTTIESRRRIAEAIQAGLARVGIELEVRSYEWGTFYADVRRGSFELYALAWVGITDPDIFHEILHSDQVPPRGNNRGGYRNPEIDLWTTQARHEHDLDARRELYRRVQSAVARDLPFVPLWWTENVVVHAPGLCGFHPSPDGSLRSLAEARWGDCPCPR